MRWIRKHVSIVIVATVWLVLFVIATFFDLQINRVIADLRSGEYISPNLFGRFFETIGDSPFYLLVAFSFLVYFRKFHGWKSTGKGLIASGLFALCSILSFYLSFRVMIGYIGEHYRFEEALLGVVDDLVCLALALTVFVLIDQRLQKANGETLRSFVALSLIVLVTAGASQLVIQGLKIFSGRARFRTMYVAECVGLDGFSYYTPWYVFSGKRSVSEAWAQMGIASDGFKSFPSGHAGASALVGVLLLLPAYFEKFQSKKWKIVLYAVGIGFPVLVGFSRMVMGAHFLSDVLFGSGITVFYLFVASKIVRRVTKC